MILSGRRFTPAEQSKDFCGKFSNAKIIMREYLQDSAQNYIINIKRNDFIVKTHKKLNKFLIIIPIPVPPKYAIIFSNQCRQYGDSSSVALFGNGKGVTMSILEVLTLILVIFAALTYIDNRNNRK